MATLGERIKCAREAKGYYQSDLAKLIGVKSAGVISNWEKGINKPDAEKIVKLCEVLDVSASFLLDYYGKAPFEVEPNEINLIKKYRLLDEDGKRFVDSTLSHESGRADQISGLEQRIADLSGEAEIEEEVEAYRRELELEKRREGEWSGSEEDAG